MSEKNPLTYKDFFSLSFEKLKKIVTNITYLSPGGTFSMLNRIERPRTFLGHSFLEDDWNGEPIFLVLFKFGAIISGVGFVS